MRLRMLVATTILAAVVGSCDSGPVAGDVTFALTTPRSDDGAIAFEVLAKSPETLAGVTPLCGGCRAFVTMVADTALRGIVTGSVTAGPVFSVTVSDTRTPASYTAKVLDVSTRAFVTHSLSGYALAPAVPK